MSIFVVFMSVVIASYSNIVSYQQNTNNYRQVYVEARTFFDKVVAEVRDGVIYYGSNDATEYNGKTDKLLLVSKDADRIISFEKVEEGILYKENIGCGREKNEYILNSEEIDVDDLSFYITPAFDPYLDDNVQFNSLQFQPKVTIKASFASDPNSIDFQTTISSRYYGQVPNVEYTCLP